MAEYRLKFGFNPGSGTILIDTVPYVGTSVISIEEGVSVDVEIQLGDGWVSSESFLNNVSFSTSLTFSFTMPSRDSTLRVVASGDFSPTDNYGKKFTGTLGQNYEGGTCYTLDIYKQGYVGSASGIQIASINYKFGNIGDDPIRTLIGSSIDFTVVGESEEFEEFLEGDNRTWKVEFKDGPNIFFVGFISPDYLTTLDWGEKQLQKFTANDGFNSFNAIRVNQLIFPGVTRDKAISAIVGALNQSFIDFRNVNIACNIWETRMDDTQNLFPQFFTPDNAIWNDGQIARYTDGTRIENDTLYIAQTLERIVNPFLCRVFLYENEFWVIRIPHLAESSYTGQVFTPDAAYDSDFTINNDLEIDCSINRPERTGRRVFTDFTATLRLGYLFKETEGSIYEAKFETEEWFVGSPVSPYPGVFQLRRWDYIRATPTNQPASAPTGDTARIQYVSNSGAETVKIWTTTTTAGSSDPNVSYISLSTDSTGRIIEVAEETANKISLSFRFMLEAVSTNPNTELNHSVGFMLRIGTQYLQRSGTTAFVWTSTPTVCEFQATNSYVFNTISIPSLTVPETGEVELRLYQLLLNGGTRHQYAIQYDDVKLTVEQNEALQLQELSTRAITDQPYSYVHPEYNTFIGDAETNLSTSAIRLDITDTPVSELWSRDGIEAEPLLDLITQELANLKGRFNRRILATIERVRPKPYQSVIYKNRLWMIISIDWDVRNDTYKVELFDIGEVPTT